MKEIILKDILNKVIFESDTDMIDAKQILLAMKIACKEVLELAAENAKIESREYKINGSYTPTSLGEEIMIEDPNIYIGIDKQSILDVIKQVK